MLTFQKDTTAASYLQWLNDNPAGFVLNVPAAGISKTLVLHAATCTFITTFAGAKAVGGDYYKACSMDRDELVQWANQQGKLQACQHCKPLATTTTPAPMRGQPSSQGQDSQPTTSAVAEVVAVAGVQSNKPPYIVRWSDYANIVEVWSNSLLPYYPKQGLWLADMKKDLGHAIDASRVEPGRVLHAVYGGPKPANADIENLLFYNVGPERFTRLTTRGLRFEALSSAAPLPQPGPSFYPCYYRYAFADVTDNAGDGRNFVSWRLGRTLARWIDLQVPPLNTSTKPHPIWYAFRTGHLDMLHMPVKTPVRFGLDISIGLPANMKASKTGVSNIVKPLLDGLISAFHAHNGKNLVELGTRLGVMLPEASDSAAIQSLLQQSDRAVLGTRELLWLFHAKSVQWNPADDICLAADIRLVPHESSKWLLSGQLFELDELDASLPLPGSGA